VVERNVANVDVVSSSLIARFVKPCRLGSYGVWQATTRCDFAAEGSFGLLKPFSLIGASSRNYPLVAILWQLRECQMTEDTKPAEIKNKVTITDAGPCKKKVAIEVPEDAVHGALGEQYKELKKDAMVPGFRKGHAPIKLLEKRFGKDIIEQVKLKLLASASDAALKDNEISALNDPDIEHDKITLPDTGPLKFEFEVEVQPEFELPATEGIELEKPAVTVTDEQLAEETTELLKRAGIWAPVEGGKVEKEDKVIADVVAKVEGEAEGRKTDNAEVDVRPIAMVGPVVVEKVDELLDGAKAGDTKTTTVDVPKTFYDESLRGKKVEVAITIRDIKRIKPAEMNEDFFKRYGVADEAELKTRMKEALESRAEQAAQTAMREQIYKYLNENTKFDLPEKIVADQSAQLLRRRYSNLLMRGMTAEQIHEQADQIKSSTDEQAKEQLKTFFIMNKLAKKFDIKVGEEEINGKVAQLAIQQGRRPEKVREEMVRDGSLASFGMQLGEEKCLEKLLASAKIVEPKEAPKKAKAPKKKAAGDKKADK
jgi:trigger factor